jgi:hypothetical protein
MKLTIADRVMLLNVMPQEGSILTLRVIRELQTELSFSDKELEELKIVNNPATGVISWPVENNDVTKEVLFSATRWNIIKTELEKRNNQNKLALNLIPLYERFVEGKRDEAEEGKKEGTA